MKAGATHPHTPAVDPIPRDFTGRARSDSQKTQAQFPALPPYSLEDQSTSQHLCDTVIYKNHIILFFCFSRFQRAELLKPLEFPEREGRQEQLFSFIISPFQSHLGLC